MGFGGTALELWWLEGEVLECFVTEPYHLKELFITMPKIKL